MIGRAVYCVLGVVEAVVDGYDAVRRFLTRREKPLPLGKRKVKDLLERQAAKAGSGVRPVPPMPAVRRGPLR